MAQKGKGGVGSPGPTQCEQRTDSWNLPSAFYLGATMLRAPPGKSSNLKTVIKNSSVGDDEWL